MRRLFLLVLAGVGLAGVGVASAFEYGKGVLERGFSEALQVPVRIERLTYRAGRLTLHETQFHPSLPLAIHRLELEGSLLRLLKDRSLSALWRGGAVESVAVRGVTFSIGGVPLRAQGRVFLTTDPKRPARCEGRLVVGHPLVNAQLEITGEVLEPVVLGWVQWAQGEPRHFVSRLRFDRSAVHLEQMQVQGGWEALGILSFPQGSSEGTGNLQFSRPARSLEPGVRYALEVKPLSGRTGEALLRIQPEGQVPERVKLSWSLDRTQVRFEASSLENRVILAGQVELHPPFESDLTLRLNQAEIAQFARWFLSGTAFNSRLNGRVEGQVRFRGPLTNLKSEGNLSVQETVFNDRKFPSAIIRFLGTGPILQVENSHLTRPGGVLLMEGVVDLRRVGQPDCFSGIRLTSMQRSFEMGGWTMTPLPQRFPAEPPGARGIQVKRAGPRESVTIGLAYGVDGQRGPEAVERERVEVEVSLSEQEQLNLRLEGEEQFLGIQHKKKF